jgi:hypothetical protein
MVYNILNYWSFGLCPSSGILKTLENALFGNWTCFNPLVKERTPTLLGPLERVNTNHWETAVFPNVFSIADNRQSQKLQ